MGSKPRGLQEKPVLTLHLFILSCLLLLRALNWCGRAKSTFRRSALVPLGSIRWALLGLSDGVIRFKDVCTIHFIHLTLALRNLNLLKKKTRVSSFNILFIYFKKCEKIYWAGTADVCSVDRLLATMLAIWAGKCFVWTVYGKGFLFFFNNFWICTE